MHFGGLLIPTFATASGAGQPALGPALALFTVTALGLLMLVLVVLLLIARRRAGRRARRAARSPQGPPPPDAWAEAGRRLRPYEGDGGG
jgi:hypothetical protein